MNSASAVGMASRQRMLSQRMTKAYLMLGQEIAADIARSILLAAMGQFESQLAVLNTFQPNPAVRSAVLALNAEWEKDKAVLSAPPSKSGAADLYDASEALQKAAHQATLAYRDNSGAALDQFINLVGRQSMLSERMAKYYFYRTWDLYHAPADMELHLNHAHFTAVLLQIESSPLSTAQLKSSVAQLRRGWEPYEEVLLASQQPAEMHALAPRVAELSEGVLAATEALLAVIMEETRRTP